MKIEYSTKGEDFLKLNEEFLLKEETMNALMLGLVENVINKKFIASTPLFLTVFEGENIIGQAIRTNEDKPIILADMEDATLDYLVDYLKGLNIDLAEVVAEKELANRFASRWSDKKNKKIELLMNQGIYELSEVIEPDYAGGKLVQATDEHLDTAREFMTGFVEDCFPRDTDPRSSGVAAADRHVKNGSLFFWINSEGEIVSCSALGRSTRNTTCINSVYTPPKFRGNGYASKMMAKISLLAISRGRPHCNLFTDLLNPTSNSIYQKVGYKMIGESIHLLFR